ncbi:CDF family Co(II)/Ni(II) efflux transporter DmeF [Desulfotignum balticum]|uniref:CDF family Co(II)/Ni(II) efflux transporter DmeF n=1 Tax=Desulfotignum balticum TaxID=115781 RepID=UPI00042656A1|nr:CDF family Co(II)/Ni(II) efflux transporter DmeF [Desulfotignum balticum]
MRTHNCSTRKLIPDSRKNETVTLIVVIITLITMIVEIIAGLISGSMALLSDGIHMGTHALALFITLAAYIFARKQMDNPSFCFGTGKVGVLGGYTNAILLLVAAAAMAFESIERLINPVHILFNQAIIVAVIGLVVNIVSAIILGHGGSDHSHDHDPLRSHDDHSEPICYHHSHEDHNLKAAYLHVITDALTSVLAIIALLAAKFFGLSWADPLVGILGAIVVTRWAIGLLKQTSSVLLDKSDTSETVARLRELIESDTTSIEDLHIWQISENEQSLILSLNSSDDKDPSFYHNLVKKAGHFDHITVEIHKHPPDS